MSRFRRKSFSALLTVAAAAGLVAGAATVPEATAATAATEASVGKVVGYFTEWGIYDRNYQVKNIETSRLGGQAQRHQLRVRQPANGQCSLGDTYADYQKVYDAGSSVDGKADTGARSTATSASCASSRRCTPA